MPISHNGCLVILLNINLIWWWRCKSCVQLPVLNKLPFLKSLRISEVINIKYIYEECYDGREVFKTLEYLSLSSLLNLTRLSRENGENMFPRFSTIYIFECHKFLAKEVLVQELHSLKKLKIYGCGKFNVLASSHCLTCLEDLTFDNYREVEGLQHLTAMKNLTVYDLRNLESLPGCLGNLSLLKSLTLKDLPKLESFPDCFENLPLLLKLTILRCPKLRCLSESLSFNNMKILWIICCCPKLRKRSEKKTGGDWPKIAHISLIHM